MPYLNVKLRASVTPETSSEIATVLTDLTAEVLRKKRELTAVAIEFVAADSWYIGGVHLDQPSSTFFLEIKVTDGTNTKDEKSHYIKRVFDAMEGILGPLAPASYVVIHEVRADAWGYRGKTQEFRYVSGKAL
jgi:4-oxalocrotonate tautomerase